jgi:hypothetical protein
VTLTLEPSGAVVRGAAVVGSAARLPDDVATLVAYFGNTDREMVVATAGTGGGKTRFSFEIPSYWAPDGCTGPVGACELSAVVPGSYEVRLRSSAGRNLAVEDVVVVAAAVGTAYPAGLFAPCGPLRTTFDGRTWLVQEPEELPASATSGPMRGAITVDSTTTATFRFEGGTVVALTPAATSRVC